ncbi:unnamed protein product [Paramecium primaurelia]|uniref:Uncharacterized protein n=1 Tax=Paramecium primaurelia TaxID=5886 RepID=A0A8S1NM57_PARPR|nr:unnamed protein product [Paramecium primaurelia]
MLFQNFRNNQNQKFTIFKKYLCSHKLIINKINMELKEKKENIQKALESEIQFAKENLVPQAMIVHYPYTINPYLTGVAKTHVYLTKKSYVQLCNRSQLQILQLGLQI